MTRKRLRLLVRVLVVFLLLVGIGVGLTLQALREVPEFYAQALVEQPDPVVRKEAAKQFEQQTLDLVKEIRHEDRFSQEFTQEQINSWLAEQFDTSLADTIPQAISDPRVTLRNDHVLVGFRYHGKSFDGIVSLNVKPRVTEPNHLALEFESVKAGDIPISLDAVTAHITDRLHREGWQTQWKLKNSHDVLVVHFPPSESDQPVLEAVQVTDGLVHISGSRVSVDKDHDRPVRGNLPRESESAPESVPLPDLEAAPASVPRLDSDALNEDDSIEIREEPDDRQKK